MFARQNTIPSHDLPELRSSRLILCPLHSSDAHAVYRAIDRSRPEFEKWFTWAHDTTPASVRQSIQEAELAMVAGSEWHYGIFVRSGAVSSAQDGQPISSAEGIGFKRDAEFCGRIGLSEIDQTAHSAELGYWLDTSFHNRGLMTEAVRLLLSLVLSDLRHICLNAYTDVENAASQRVLSRCGFRKVGSVVNAVNHPQRGWRDQYHYSLISDGS